MCRYVRDSGIACSVIVLLDSVFVLTEYRSINDCRIGDILSPLLSAAICRRYTQIAHRVLARCQSVQFPTSSPEQTHQYGIIRAATEESNTRFGHRQPSRNEHNKKVYSPESYCTPCCDRQDLPILRRARRRGTVKDFVLQRASIRDAEKYTKKRFAECDCFRGGSCDWQVTPAGQNSRVRD
jgi:hypothetical protein